MQTKTRKLIVSLSSLVLSGFLLHHYLTVGAKETTTNTIQKSQKFSISKGIQKFS